MCFSASASFGTGVVLSLIGLATVRKIEKPAYLPFGLFPFVFAMQQFAEGFVWLAFINSFYTGWQNTLNYAFLTFSHIIWPVWIPLSVLLLEKEFRRQKTIRFLLIAGVILGLYHFYCLLLLPVATRIDGHHLQYLIAHPKSFRMPANVFYALATIPPFFISSVKRMWWIGLFIIVSYMVTFIIYQDFIVSVWCFFATFISVFVYRIVANFQKARLIK